jgi:hypothetical protein
MANREDSSFFDIQSNEIEALRAIYVSEFEELSRGGADAGEFNWVFKIKLATPITLKADLVVKFPKKYPSVVPVLQLENRRGIFSVSVIVFVRVRA